MAWGRRDSYALPTLVRKGRTMLKQAGQRVQMSLRDVSRAICPYCRAEAGSAEELVGCERCGTVHHRECWDENGHRCAVRACEGGDELRRDAHAQWRQVEEHAAAEANPGTRARHLTRCQRRRVWSTTEETFARSYGIRAGPRPGSCPCCSQNSTSSGRGGSQSINCEARSLRSTSRLSGSCATT